MDNWKRERQQRQRSKSSIPTSAAGSGAAWLRKFKTTDLYTHNINPNFDADFLSVVNLSRDSAVHNNFDYLDVTTNFAMPLLMNSYILYLENNVARGYLSWALFDEENERTFFNDRKLVTNPKAVLSGDRMWVIDLIAPYGHVKQTVKTATAHLKSIGIDRAKMKFVREYKDGSRRPSVWNHK